MKKRRLPLAALALALPGFVAAQSGDAPPSTPTDLVANVYSDTAGGIRWSRSNDDRGAVGGYEVTRDGTVLAMRDALSYVDPSLAPATTYTYGVTAIDSAGQRSGTATIRLRTSGGTPPEALAAPEGLRASVYSATAAELFWTRPATFGLRYEVLRDGTSLAVTDGTSYFDPGLVGGTSYEYGVVAVDRQGARSTPSTIVLETPGGRPPDPSPGVDAENFAGILALAARLVTDTFDFGFSKFVDIAREDSGTADRDSIFPIDAEGAPTVVGPIVLSCPRSGTVTINETAFFDYEDTYEECDTPQSTIGGTIVEYGDTSSAGVDVDLAFENLSFFRFAPDIFSHIGKVAVRGSAFDLCTECTGSFDYTLHEYREEAGVGADKVDFLLTGSGIAGGDSLGVDASPFEDAITLFSSANYHVLLNAYPGIVAVGSEPLSLDVDVSIDVEGFGLPGSRIEVVGADGSAVRASFQGGLVGVPGVELEDAAGNSTFETLDWFEIFPYPPERGIGRIKGL